LRPKPWLVERTTTEGQIGVMPGHTPLLVDLDLGELVTYEGEQRQTFLVSGGFARIMPERLSVLAFSIEVNLDAPARQRCEARWKELEN
jgi:F-type H+-transporting ATPase subunit epsilon